LLKVESIVSDLSMELFPWDYTPYSLDDFYFGIGHFCRHLVRFIHSSDAAGPMPEPFEPRPEPLPENVRSMVMALRNMSATGRRQKQF
jgi:hypothetical protein